MANQLWRANQHEHACFGISCPWSFPSRSGILHFCRIPALTFFAAINFAMKRCAPCSAVLRYTPSSWAVVVHRSGLIPKALIKHPVHSSSCLLYQLSLLSGYLLMRKTACDFNLRQFDQPSYDVCTFFGSSQLSIRFGCCHTTKLSVY